jgi:hypothetical protein
MNLYEIDAALRYLLNRADNGELDGELSDQLDALELAREVKMQSILMAIVEAEAQAAAHKAESERHKSQQIRHEDKAEYLRNYVQQSMQAAGETKLDLPLFKARLQKNPPSVRFNGDPKELDALFVRTKTEITLDKTAILDLWKHRKKLPEGVTVVQELSLRVS